MFYPLGIQLVPLLVQDELQAASCRTETRDVHCLVATAQDGHLGPAEAVSTHEL